MSWNPLENNWGNCSYVCELQIMGSNPLEKYWGNCSYASVSTLVLYHTYSYGTVQYSTELLWEGGGGCCVFSCVQDRGVLGGSNFWRK